MRTENYIVGNLIIYTLYRIYEPGFLVGVSTGYLLDNRGSIPDRYKEFFFSTAFRLALGPTQPPMQ
jgi:hypothetical protein